MALKKKIKDNLRLKLNCLNSLLLPQKAKVQNAGAKAWG